MVRPKSRSKKIVCVGKDCFESDSMSSVCSDSDCSDCNDCYECRPKKKRAPKKKSKSKSTGKTVKSKTKKKNTLRRAKDTSSSCDCSECEGYSSDECIPIKRRSSCYGCN